MPLWGKVDNAANSDLAAVQQYNMEVTRANQTSLYKNTTADAFVEGAIVGQFAVDTNEVAANPTIPHAGWVLRKEGTGLRAGRVTYEVLVAGGTYGVPDGSDDTVMPDYVLRVTTNPTSKTSNVASDQTFTVAGASTPAGATLAYRWQKQDGNTWVDLSNAAGQYANVSSATFTANNETANGNVFRARVSTTGANTVYSTSATILYVTP